MRNLSFGFRSAAVVATLLLIGSALLVVSLRNSSNSQLSAKGTNPPSVEQSRPNDQVANVKPQPDRVGVTQVTPGSVETNEQVAISRGLRPRRTVVAPRRGDSGANPRLETLDTGISPATVMHAEDTTNAKSSNVFPIGTSFQSLKVSLDDGRGSSRTISVPSVSFGSQRVLSPGSSSLLASARSDW